MNCVRACGSSELEYHLLPAHDLQLLTDGDYATLAQQTRDVKRMLTGFLQKLTVDR